MFKNIFLVIFISFTAMSFAQETESLEADVPYAVIEEVPVYPGCNGSNNAELKNCMSTKISKFVAKNFDLDKINTLGLEPKRYRVAVQFKIDKDGYVTNVRARASHPQIEEEAIRVVSTLPQMKPGKQRGENVGVLYSLPIVFMIEPPSKKELKKAKKKN